MWDLPGPGLEPMFPALAGGFLTTAPPGKSLKLFFKSINISNANMLRSEKLSDTINCPYVYTDYPKCKNKPSVKKKVLTAEQNIG